MAPGCYIVSVRSHKGLTQSLASKAALIESRVTERRKVAPFYSTVIKGIFFKEAFAMSFLRSQLARVVILAICKCPCAWHWQTIVSAFWFPLVNVSVSHACFSFSCLVFIFPQIISGHRFLYLQIKSMRVTITVCLSPEEFFTCFFTDWFVETEVAG